ncbi:MAG: hypothetical protein JF612_12500 [Planctomycetia bacterium]|nr:hypothetical protein [Planctomycetia bacterium]
MRFCFRFAHLVALRGLLSVLFRIEQVVAEPLVADPVAIAFDENARLYVVEMRGYSENKDEKLSRIRLIEDTDGDGKFDKSTIFKDGLAWPTAIFCWAGGVLVVDAPDIFYFKDTSGDGQADNDQARPLSLRGRDIAIDPRNWEVTPVSGGAQHGLSFDDWGNRFVCSNSDHLQEVMYEDRYLARNPYIAAPSPRRSIAADGPQADVFRTSPVEPWRIVRTRLRATGVVPGIVEGGGRPAGYFTGATGTTIYRGDAWPSQWHGVAIVGDVGSNLVHRKRLEPDGVGFIGRRIDEKSEFISSSDIWFRPVQFANAPDGTLYILDMYREVIEHPASLPPIIKKHLDLTSGRDRGRIYRVVSNEFKQPQLPKLASAAIEVLVALLQHPNGWHRDTAARLIDERQDKAAIAPLAKMAIESQLPLARMHAMHCLAGLDAISEEVLLPRLSDEHPGVREHAIRLGEKLASSSPVIQRRLLKMTSCRRRPSETPR